MADEKAVVKPLKINGGGRSVNHPQVKLADAVKQVKSLWDAAGKHAVHVPDAGKAWGYQSEKSSGLRSTVSALKQYGLLADIGGGENRKVQLTDRGLDLVLEPDDSPKRQAAIRAAVRAPKIYSEVLANFPDGLPTADHIIESYVLRDKGFNRATVKDFVADFRANLAYANLVSPDRIPPLKDQDASDDEVEIEVGDWVQWEVNGALKMEQAMRVRAIQEHEGANWLFVEGSETGIPMTEAILERKGEPAAPAVKPPTLPLTPPASGQVIPAQGEREWLRGPLSRDVSYRLIVTGEMSEKEIGKLIRVLKAQREVLTDSDDDDEEKGKDA